jgi:hypothetical protein
MRLVHRFALFLPLAAILAGCGDTKYRADAMPPIEANQARIVFFRNASFVGADMQTGILYDGSRIGDSKPGSYFYIDTTPGTHDVSTTNDTNSHLSFPLAPGQTRYVKTEVGLGQFAGRIEPELVDPSRAMRELPELTFAPSGPTYVAGKPVTAPADQATDMQVAAPDQPRRGGSSDEVDNLARREKQCDPINSAELVSSDGSIEYYRAQCRDGRVFRAKCQSQQCVEIDSD